jgi:hypothetical protein
MDEQEIASEDHTCPDRQRRDLTAGWLAGKLAGHIIGVCALICLVFLGLGCVVQAFKWFWRVLWE